MIQVGTKLQAQSSVYGKIEQLLVVDPRDPSELTREDILARFEKLFTEFGDRVTFIILSNYGKELEGKEYLEVREQFQSAFSKALEKTQMHPAHHIIHLPAPMTIPWKEVREDGNNFNHSDFIQDPFVVMQDQYGNPVLAESYRSPNYKNQYVTEQIAAATGILMRPTEFWIEGGNILVGNDYALIGKNLLARNHDLLYRGLGLDEKIGGKSPNAERTPREVISSGIKRLLGVRYLIWIGEEEKINLSMEVKLGACKLQPFFHLDLYLTLIGMNNKGEEMVLLGEIDLNYVSGPQEEVIEELKKLNQLLTKTRQELEDSGVKKPGPIFEVRQIPMGGKVSKTSKGYKFTPYSYNNCQVEWYHGVKRIYLPHYPETVELEKRLLSDLGGMGFPKFEFISYDLGNYAKNGGSLHCLTKVLKRSNY